MRLWRDGKWIFRRDELSTRRASGLCLQGDIALSGLHGLDDGQAISGERESRIASRTDERSAYFGFEVRVGPVHGCVLHRVPLRFREGGGDFD